MAEQNNKAESRLGRVMLYVGWVLVLVVLVSLFSDFELSRINPNRNLSDNDSSGFGGTNEVVLEKNTYGHYVFTGLANGKEVDFLLDTGATRVVFTERQATELGLEKGQRMRVSTANGDTWSYSTRLDSLQIGPIVLYDVQASINPSMEVEALLGMTALGNLEWSQIGDQLTIRQPVSPNVQR